MSQKQPPREYIPQFIYSKKSIGGTHARAIIIYPLTTHAKEKDDYNPSSVNFAEIDRRPLYGDSTEISKPQTPGPTPLLKNL